MEPNGALEITWKRSDEYQAVTCWWPSVKKERHQTLPRLGVRRATAITPSDYDGEIMKRRLLLPGLILAGVSQPEIVAKGYRHVRWALQ